MFALKTAHRSALELSFDELCHAFCILRRKTAEEISRSTGYRSLLCSSRRKPVVISQFNQKKKDLLYIPLVSSGDKFWYGSNKMPLFSVASANKTMALTPTMLA
jgi:hypothetical protein